MKKPMPGNYLKYIILIFCGSLIIIVISYSLSKSVDQSDIFSSANTNVNTKLSDNQKILSYIGSDKLGNNIYQSLEYNFVIKLDKIFSYRLEENSGNMKFSISFFSLNPDINENANRATPNKFNTSADNALGLDIYYNDQRLNTSNIEEFRNWHNQNIPGRSIVNQEQMTNKRVVMMLEEDGIDSVGQYFYLLGDDYIFVLGSNDFTKQEMLGIVESFIILE